MYQSLSQYYDLLFPTQQKINSFLERFIKANGKALDLGCGTGRLTKRIHHFSMDVLGVDIDPFMIDIAKMKYPKLNFVEKDILEITKEPDQFDLITCFGNTLPHLNPSQLQMLFENFKKRLTQNGYVVLHLLNYISIMDKKPQELPQLKYNDISLRRIYEYHEDYIDFITILKIDQEVIKGTTKLYPYTLFDLKNILDTLHLRYQTYGNLSFKSFEPDDYYLYLVISLT